MTKKEIMARIEELNSHITQAIQEAKQYINHIENNSEDKDFCSLRLHQLTLKCIVLLGQMIHTSSIAHKTDLDAANKQLGSLAEVVQHLVPSKKPTPEFKPIQHKHVKPSRINPYDLSSVHTLHESQKK